MAKSKVRCVDQRAKMTRFPGFSASNFDHPGVCATIRSSDRRTWGNGMVAPP